MNDELQRDETDVAPPLPANGKPEIQLTCRDEAAAEVEERITKANVLDVQRYLRWADKILKRKTSDKAA